MRKALGCITAALVVVATGAAAQGPSSGPTTGFALGYTDIGPVVGLGGIGEAGLSLGGRFETAFKKLDNGAVIGISAGFDWYSYDDGVYSWTYTPISATANYHFKLDNKKWDPFLGLGLGYYIVSSPSGFAGSYNSGIYFVGRAGIRYFATDKLALYADAGAGAGALHLGAMFRLKGPK
jgi:outer membrane protein with beta-barrel domain